MPGPLKRYGMYWVFAAMSTTGVFLWNSQRTDLSAESAAEIFNGAAERLLVPQLTGTNLPNWNSIMPTDAVIVYGPNWPGQWWDFDVFYYPRTNLFPSAVPTIQFAKALSRVATSAFGVSPGTTWWDSSTDEFSAADTDWSPDVSWLVDDTVFYDQSAEALSLTTGYSIRPWLYADYHYGKAYETSNSTSAKDGVPTTLTTSAPGGPWSSAVPSDVPVTNQPFCAALSAASALSGTYAGHTFTLPARGHYWPTGVLGRAFVPQRLAYSNRYDKVFRRTDIMAPYTILTNLNQTFKVIAPGWLVTNNVYSPTDVSWDGYTNAVVPLDTYKTAAWNATAILGSQSYQSSDPRWYSDFYYNAFYQEIRGHSPGPGETYFSGQHYKILPTNIPRTNVVSYPSTYAVTNGHVSRVRLYGLFSWGSDKNPPITHYDNGEPLDGGWVTNVAVAGALPVDLASLGLTMTSPSAGSALATYNTAGIPAGYSGTAMSNKVALINKVSSTDNRGKQYVLVELVDITNPTVSNLTWDNIPLPEFDIDLPPFAADTLSFARADDPGYPDFTGDMLSYSEYLYDYSVDVRIKAVVVVVDWKFKHLDPNTPYVAP